LTAAFLCDISISMPSTKAKTEEKNRITISKSMSAPRYSGVATFMRTDLVHDPSELDIVLIGVSYDGAVESRSGARHGPREVRNMSSMMRAIHHMTRINPYKLCDIEDIGDVPFTNVYKFEEVHNDITIFFRRCMKPV
jgi:guanidinopropionase